MRPVFCGSFDYDTRQSELDRLFSKFGRVERVDMKSGVVFLYYYHGKDVSLRCLNEDLLFLHACSLYKVSVLRAAIGFAFVYFEDERDAEDAIKSLDNSPFGRTKRRLSVEWARGERGSQHRESSKSMANQRPTKTLFVINFDPINTRTKDIEKHFEPYGKVVHVRIRRNFAFVQFENQEDATKALECTHMSKVLGRVVSVEYALRDDGERGDRHGSPRRGGFGGRGGGSPYGRSRSPMPRRSRPSPDYGRGRSPDYGRGRSPDHGRGRSPAYGRARSPVYDKYNGPSYDREHNADYGRYRSRSPVRR